MMATTTSPTSPPDATAAAPSEFQLRRAALVSEIGDALEQVLSQINALNRGLEGIIEIGNEFASVEALWSQFEGVMGPAHPNGSRGVGQKEGDGKVQGEEDGGNAAEEEETELAEGEGDERGR